MARRFSTPDLLIDHKRVGQKEMNGVPPYNARPVLSHCLAVVTTESVSLPFSIFANGICSRLYTVPRCFERFN